MRDATALQRRRRMMLLNRQTDASQHGLLDDPLDVLKDRLLQHCSGQKEVLLLIEVGGEAHARQITLDRPYLVVGSNESCDVVIKRPEISSRHAYIQWIEGKIYCECLAPPELKKVTGTWLCRKPVTVGSLRLSTPDFGEPGTSDPQTRCPDLAAEVPQVYLQFAGVCQQDNTWIIDRRLTLIGRSPACRLRLDHPDIPMFFASMIRTQSSCWLVNLCGSELLRVNGQPFELRQLEIGDSIQFGEFSADVNAAPFSLKQPRPERRAEKHVAGVQNLATQHRKRLGNLTASLEAVKLFLDSDHLRALPEMTAAFRKYILQAEAHHQEMQEALDRLAVPVEA